MLTNRKFINFDDYKTCTQYLKDRNYEVVNMTDLISQISALTGNSYPWLYRYTCMSPFNLNGTEHSEIRRMLASYFSAKRLKSWHSTLQKHVEYIVLSLHKKINIDLMEDLIKPITSACTFYALGLDSRLEVVSDKCIDHLLQLTSFSKPLKISDFSKLNTSAELLASSIMDSRIHKKLPSNPIADNNKQKNDVEINDFYHYLSIRFNLLPQDICAYMSVILAAGFSTKHTLANIFIELLSLSEEDKVRTAAAHDSKNIVERSLYVAGGVETLYRLDQNQNLACLNIAKASEALLKCPFSLADEPEKRYLAFGSGAHKCIGELFAKLIMEIALESFMRHHPKAKINERPPFKFYTYSPKAPIKVILNGS